MTPRLETSAPSVQAFFEAWSTHDLNSLNGLFADGATYEDPGTEGPRDASVVREIADDLRAALPDLTFEIVAITGDSSRWMAEWIMRGNHRGVFRASVAPTHQPVTLAGVDVFALDTGRIRSVRRYYDQKAWVEQMGMMALVQPIEQGPAKYGYSMRVASGNRKPPGIVALTWIQGANDEEKERIRSLARENVRDFLAEPGFISIVTGFTGLRGFTVTAWEDEASMKRGLSLHHAQAMRELFGERFVASVWTSVWQPTRINRIWLRCPSCGVLEDVSDDHRTCTACALALPPQPEFW